MKHLRDYQKENAQKGYEILKALGLVYLQMEVRTGKSVTALQICKLFGSTKVLFLTKKKAISSIQGDYDDFGYTFSLTVINDESMHTISDNDFDLVIHDEHHRFGSFPKPGKCTKAFKDRFSKLPMIFLSGTPHPESYSQIYHQFWVSSRSPFIQYANFYKWFNGMGFVKTSFDLGYGEVANYTNNEDVIMKYFAVKARKLSKDDPNYAMLYSAHQTERSEALSRHQQANARLMEIIEPYMVKFTQEEAGFQSQVHETVLYCRMRDITYSLISKLKKDRVVRGSEEVILADTPVKLLGKIHQLSSGTIKFESKNCQILDNSKALFIKEKFAGKKIGIFYKFQAELQMLKDVFGDMICQDLETFNSTSKNIALQIVSGREGISLKNADYLVYFNIDFSSLSYWQSRDRLTTMDRKSNEVFWIFSEGGIESEIYKTVVKKKDYTLSVFKKDFKISA